MQFCTLNSLNSGHSFGTADGDWYFNNYVDKWHRVYCRIIITEGNGILFYLIIINFFILGDWNDTSKSA